MRFVLLVYGDEQAEQALPPEDLRAIVRAHRGLAERLEAEGKLVDGEGLQASTSAVTVDGETGVVTDGPYTSTKEQIGGLYIVDLEDLDEALALAKELPPSPGLKVEIRPI